MSEINRRNIQKRICFILLGYANLFSPIIYATYYVHNKTSIHLGYTVGFRLEPSTRFCFAGQYGRLLRAWFENNK
jgi:hypothetical protein